MGNTSEPSAKAAERGEPSYVWRDGQRRRFALIQQSAGERKKGKILENGSGVGSYLHRIAPYSAFTVGIEIEFERVQSSMQQKPCEKMHALNGCGEYLPFAPNTFDLILSHEVIEHVTDDHQCIAEMVRCLKVGGRIVLFCPNRGYPFETHGCYWKGQYHFGNIPLINYLPKAMRNRLAPHVRVYSVADLEALFVDLPVTFITQTIIFGAYDNIIARSGKFGRILRATLQALEKTALRIFGLSHFWVIEKR